MSKSAGETFLLTLSESEKTLKQKVAAILTGSRETRQEQQAHGGQPDNCRVFDLFTFFFLEDDTELAKRKEECLSGKILCGECKSDLSQRIACFIAKHQERKAEKFDVAKQILKGEQTNDL